MKRFLPLVILGAASLVYGLSAQAAGPASDWPALNGGGAQTNANLTETSLTPGSIHSLHVIWAVPVPYASYPVVAAGLVYVPVTAGKSTEAAALNASTGKVVARYKAGAAGGILIAGGKLYLAGRSLQVFDPVAGTPLASISASPRVSRSTFAYPLADRHIVIAGYAPETSGLPNSVYAVDPAADQLLWHIPSLSAQAALVHGRVLDLLSSGSAFFNERGRQLASQPALFGDWFGGPLSYIVASVSSRDTRVYAYTAAGSLQWSRRVGPAMSTQGWAHAVSPSGLYVMTEQPEGVVALSPSTGTVLWHHALPGIERLAYANTMVFALTAGVGQPVKLVVYRAVSGKLIGAVQLSAGYDAFPSLNELMVADGMVFIRANAPTNQSMLVALAP
ncbi:MAG TPA: PQQ-binding-like beta-propeller repeat protein [Chloroflexota bacterium]|nr:PQQ-binding-like beta-propeller repeat protein [Chloroflexota bacterium]